MNEQFCNYEISKKLKELGFNNPCLGYYYDKKLEHFALFGTIEGKSIDFENNSDTNLIILAPLWQQVIDWFKEKYNIHIEITHHVTEQYDINYKYYVIKNPVDCIECYENAYYKTYEKVREQAILKALELCQKK